MFTNRRLAMERLLVRCHLLQPLAFRDEELERSFLVYRNSLWSTRVGENLYGLFYLLGVPIMVKRVARHRDTDFCLCLECGECL